jgi:putative redox protein
MEMLIDFPGGARVDAHFGHQTVKTNQDGTDPSPFATFLASIGTCAGIFVLSFCQQRGLSTEGVRLIQRMATDPFTHLVSQIDLEIQVPPEFPKEYYDALVRTANLCTVKRTLEKPPKFNTYTKVA